MINSIKKYKKLGLGLLVLLSLLIFIPFLISTQSYLNEAQALASKSLGVPVSIKRLNIYLLPRPHVKFNEIVVADNALVTIESVSVTPQLLSLLRGNLVVDVHIKAPIIQETAFPIIGNFLQSPSKDTNSDVHIRKVIGEEVTFVASQFKLPKLNVHVELNADAAVVNAELATIDKQLTAMVMPQHTADKQSVQAIEILLNDWVLPVGAPFVIEKGHVHAQFKNNTIEVHEIDLALYGGQVKGVASLLIPENNQQKWRLKGDLKFNGVDVKAPSRLINSKVYLSGNVSGQGTFKSEVSALGDLASQLKAQFNFNVRKGVLHGLDLIKVASLLVKQGKQGGDTAFDHFSGTVSMQNGAYHFQNLKLSSGFIAGTGQVHISPNSRLKGKGEIELKQSVSLVAIPVEVSGTIEQPMVYPSKAAIAGAVAGTGILGPGVGTSLGIKAGSAVDKIKGFFGGD